MEPYAKFPLKKLEFHITHACNLRCQGCLHYCDLQYHEPVDIAEMLANLKLWSQRLIPDSVRILGGEPLLEPGVLDYLYGCAEYFPQVRRQLITNGILLERWGSELPAALNATETELLISEHPMTPSQKSRFDKGLHMVGEWRKKWPFAVCILPFIDDSQWKTTYRGVGIDMLPFEDNDPALSRKTCTSINCKHLLNGKLYMCPELAYLPLVVNKLTNKRAWEPYLEYTPLDFSASDEELAVFCANKGDLQYCAMCPPSLVNITPEG